MRRLLHRYNLFNEPQMMKRVKKKKTLPRIKDHTEFIQWEVGHKISSAGGKIKLTHNGLLCISWSNNRAVVVVKQVSYTDSFKGQTRSCMKPRGPTNFTVNIIIVGRGLKASCTTATCQSTCVHKLLIHQTWNTQHDRKASVQRTTGLMLRNSKHETAP